MDNLNFLKRKLNLVLAFSLLTSASMVMADTDSHETHFGTIDAINGDFGSSGSGFVAGSLDDVNDNDWVTFDAGNGETVELLLSNTDASAGCQGLDFAIFRDENDNGVIEVGDVANVTNFNMDQTGSGTDIVVQHAGWNSTGFYFLCSGESEPFSFQAPVTGQYVVGVASSNASQALDYSIEVVGHTGAGSRATFPVNKDFDDDNPVEVAVTISCNTGLPLEQSSMISEGDGVVFVVTDFNHGELDCEVFEDPVPAGYQAEYFENGQSAGALAESCTFENVFFGAENTCLIENSLQEVTVEVTKEWIDENPQFNPVNFAEADYSCSSEQFGDAFGQLTFLGNPGTDSFDVFPHWNGLTTCTVTETLVDSGVETDSSDCQSLSVTPGNGASCTIVNTRLFEGIPTLSQYGLGLLALLMLGVGFVAFRRIV